MAVNKIDSLRMNEREKITFLHTKSSVPAASFKDGFCHGPGEKSKPPNRNWAWMNELLLMNVSVLLTSFKKLVVVETGQVQGVECGVVFDDPDRKTR